MYIKISKTLFNVDHIVSITIPFDDPTCIMVVLYEGVKYCLHDDPTEAEAEFKRIESLLTNPVYIVSST